MPVNADGGDGKPRYRVSAALCLHVCETALLAGIVVWVAARISLAAHWPPEALPGAEVALGLVVAATGLIITSAQSVTVYLMAWGLFAPAWTAIAWFEGVWQRWVFAALALFTLGMMPWGILIFGKLERYHHQQADRRKAIEGSSEKVGWQRTFAGLGCPGISVDDIIKTRAGVDLLLSLPGKGDVTLEALEAICGKIEVRRRLRRGAIRIEQGENAHQVTMHITTRHVLEEDVRYPMDLVHRTVNDAIPVGMFENGEIATITLREVAALVIGVRGSGKTNFLNVLIAQLSQCVDVLIFMIDMKGGAAASPWLVPWVNDECHAPAIDWVATDRDEAEIMLRTLLDWTEIRTRGHVGREKVKPSPTQPAIVLIVDEMSRVFGQRKPREGETSNAVLAELAEEITSISRSSAIDPVLATQRGTVTKIGSGDLKSHCALRIGMGAVSEADASYIFQNSWKAARLLQRISTIPGAGMIEYGKTSAPLKFYRINPDDGDVQRVARWAGDFRPKLEASLLRSAGTAYSERWTVRGQNYLQQIRAGTVPTDLEDRFLGVIEGGGAADLGNVSQPRMRVREIVRESGAVGSTPGWAFNILEAEGFETHRETVNRWMSDDVDSGLMLVKNPGTRNVRYFWNTPAIRSLPSTGTGG